MFTRLSRFPRKKNAWIQVTLTIDSIACEQPLLFGRVKRAARKRASKRRSREGPPPVLRLLSRASRASTFHRACSQAIYEGSNRGYATKPKKKKKQQNNTVEYIAGKSFLFIHTEGKIRLLILILLLLLYIIIIINIIINIILILILYYYYY